MLLTIPAMAEAPVRSTISVSGTAYETQVPDTAIITLGVETRAKDVTLATSQNSKKANQIISAVKPLLNIQRGDSIKTSSYTVRPYYEYNKSSQKNEIQGYIVENKVIVKTYNIQQIGNIIDKAIQNGANNVQNLDFSLENKDKCCQSVVQKAARSARAEAEALAAALGVKITGIKSVSSSCGGEFARPMAMYLKGSANKEMDAISTPIEPGDMKIQGNVNIEFYISE